MRLRIFRSPREGWSAASLSADSLIWAIRSAIRSRSIDLTSSAMAGGARPAGTATVSVAAAMRAVAISCEATLTASLEGGGAPLGEGVAAGGDELFLAGDLDPDSFTRASFRVVQCGAVRVCQCVSAVDYIAGWRGTDRARR